LFLFKIKILLTGSGRASKGSIEMLEHANIKQVSINDYLNKKYNEAIFSNISSSIKRSSNRIFVISNISVN